MYLCSACFKNVMEHALPGVAPKVFGRGEGATFVELGV